MAIDIDSAVLRRAAAALTARATAIQARATAMGRLSGAAESESAAFIAKHGPTGSYPSAVSSLTALANRFATEADHAGERLRAKAAELTKLADQHDATEDKNVTTVHHLPTETFTI